MSKTLISHFCSISLSRLLDRKWSFYLINFINILLCFLGACENSEEVFQINPDTRQVSCIPRMAAKSKRIFDVLPSNMRHNGGSLEGSEGGFGANMLNCLSGSNKCSAGRLGKGTK